MGRCPTPRKLLKKLDQNFFVLPHLAAAPDEEFIADQLLQSHGAPGVELLGGDADFRPQAKLASVRKPGGGVYIHGGGVHFLQEPLGIGVVLGDDALTVTGGIPGR